jgi:ankyrin repeat protein
MAAAVQQESTSLTPIKTRPRCTRKVERKKVSAPLETSAFDPHVNNDLLRLTPSKRKRISLKEVDGEQSSSTELLVKKSAVPVEEAQEALCRGATRGDVKAIRKAIASGALVSVPNSKGLTPVMQCAASQGETAAEALQLLVDHSAQVDVLDKHGWNALHYACRSGREDSAKYLVSVSANPALPTNDSYKKTTLMLAVEDGKPGLVHFLAKHNAETRKQLNAQDANGWTALHFAMKGGSKDIVQDLLDQGAKTKLRACDGQQPFMIACEHGKLDCAKFFMKRLQKHIDVDAQDQQKRTALMMACTNGYEDVALWLIGKCKADKYITDVNGESAVKIAKGLGLHKAMAALVRKKEEGADEKQNDAGK